MFEDSYKKYLVDLSNFFLFQKLHEVDLENPKKTGAPRGPSFETSEESVWH